MTDEVAPQMLLNTGSFIYYSDFTIKYSQSGVCRLRWAWKDGKASVYNSYGDRLFHNNTLTEIYKKYIRDIVEE